MKKGPLFLSLTVLLLVLMLLLFFFGILTPPEKKTDSTNGATIITADCEADMTCFEKAIKNNCEKVAFILPHPFAEDKYLEGVIKGKLFGKCEVLLKDLQTNLNMTCYISEGSLTGIDSLDKLKKACSGPLISTFKENASKYDSETQALME